MNLETTRNRLSHLEILEYKHNPPGKILGSRHFSPRRDIRKLSSFRILSFRVCHVSQCFHPIMTQTHSQTGKYSGGFKNFLDGTFHINLFSSGSVTWLKRVVRLFISPLNDQIVRPLFSSLSVLTTNFSFGFNEMFKLGATRLYRGSWRRPNYNTRRLLSCLSIYPLV